MPVKRANDNKSEHWQLAVFMPRNRDCMIINQRNRNTNEEFAYSK